MSLLRIIPTHLTTESGKGDGNSEVNDTIQYSSQTCLDCGRKRNKEYRTGQDGHCLVCSAAAVLFAVKRYVFQLRTTLPGSFGSLGMWMSTSRQVFCFFLRTYISAQLRLRARYVLPSIPSIGVFVDELFGIKIFMFVTIGVGISCREC